MGGRGSSPQDFLPWVEFSTLRSWDPIARYYLDVVSPLPGDSLSIRRLAHKWTLGVRSDREKVAAVYRHVAEDIASGRLPSEFELPKPRPLASITEDLRGDCKDKSALLAFLLRSLGIRAHVAAILTHLHGSGDRLPAPIFNHAVVVADIEGEELWLEPTAPACVFGELPGPDQGAQALVLDPENPRPVKTPTAPPERSALARTCRGRLDPEGAYHFRATVKARGDYATEVRGSLLDGEQVPELVESIELTGRAGVEIEISDARMYGQDDFADELCYECEVVHRHRSRRVGVLELFTIPWTISLLSPALLQKKRHLPLVVRSTHRIDERHEIELPPGFNPYGLPDEIEHESPWGGYRLVIRLEEGRLIGERRFTLESGTIPAHSFPGYREFCQACARADSVDVVLVPEDSPDWPPGATS